MDGVCSRQDISVVAVFSLAAAGWGYLQYKESRRANLLAEQQWKSSEEANALTRAMIPSAELFVHVEGRTKDEDEAFEVRLCNAGAVSARVRQIKIVVSGASELDASDRPIAEAFFCFCKNGGVALRDSDTGDRFVPRESDPVPKWMDDALCGHFLTYVVPANGYVEIMRVSKKWRECVPLEALNKFCEACSLKIETPATAATAATTPKIMTDSPNTKKRGGRKERESPPKIAKTTSTETDATSVGSAASIAANLNVSDETAHISDPKTFRLLLKANAERIADKEEIIDTMKARIREMEEYGSKTRIEMTKIAARHAAVIANRVLVERALAALKQAADNHTKMSTAEEFKTFVVDPFVTHGREKRLKQEALAYLKQLEGPKQGQRHEAAVAKTLSELYTRLCDPMHSMPEEIDADGSPGYYCGAGAIDLRASIGIVIKAAIECRFNPFTKDRIVYVDEHMKPKVVLSEAKE